MSTLYGNMTNICAAMILPILNLKGKITLVALLFCAPFFCATYSFSAGFDGYLWLESLIAAYFKGIPPEKSGEIMFSDPGKQKRYIGMLHRHEDLPEIYTIKRSKIIVVNEFSVTRKFRESTNECIDVKFSVLGVAERRKGRTSCYERKIKERRFIKNVKFCAKKDGMTWKWIDPKDLTPHVNVDILIEDVKEDIIMLKFNLNNFKIEKNKRKCILRWNKSLEKNLDALYRMKG